jgi:uncharacterized phage infection (PIP) family protein YhgE
VLNISNINAQSKEEKKAIHQQIEEINYPREMEQRNKMLADDIKLLESKSNNLNATEKDVSEDIIKLEDKIAALPEGSVANEKDLKKLIELKERRAALSLMQQKLAERLLAINYEKELLNAKASSIDVKE